MNDFQGVMYPTKKETHTLGKNSNRSPRTFQILVKLLKQNLFLSLVRFIRMIFQNMQLTNAFTELSSRHKQRYKVAFKRINKARVNAHMTLQNQTGLIIT